MQFRLYPPCNFLEKLQTGKVEWDAVIDPWGNAPDIYNPYKLRQPIRMQGRYITQDSIGLRGGWDVYRYPLNPMQGIDPLGLSVFNGIDIGAGTN